MMFRFEIEFYFLWQISSKLVYLSQRHWYSALVWLLYYSFVEKCDNYSDVRKDKAANQPQIIGKRVAKDFLSWAAIVKCMYYLKNKLSNCRWSLDNLFVWLN